MALNKSLVGKQYPPQQYKITAEEAKKYAYGYNETCPLFLDEAREGGIIAPPMFGVKYAGAPFAQAFFDPDLNVDFPRLVHGEHSMTFHAPVRPGDLITSVGTIASIEEKSTGEIFVVDVHARNQLDQAVLDMSGTFFIRGARSGSDKKKGAEEHPVRAYDFTQTMKVEEDQTYRYAEGSGDYNPIHVNPEFARSVGLPGIILQGLCTMAFCFKAIQDECCGGDPLRIKRLKVRFAKPILPLDTVTTRGWVEQAHGGVTILAVEAVNQRGEVVLRDGRAEILS
jgi:acyl dehydratase